MKRLHVALRVNDLEEARRFYTYLLDAEPTVRASNYVNWILEDPPVDLSLTEKVNNRGIEHLGIKADTPEELLQLCSTTNQTSDSEHPQGARACSTTSATTWLVDQHGVPWRLFASRKEDSPRNQEAALNFSDIAGAAGPRQARRVALSFQEQE